MNISINSQNRKNLEFTGALWSFFDFRVVDQETTEERLLLFIMLAGEIKNLFIFVVCLNIFCSLASTLRFSNSKNDNEAYKQSSDTGIYGHLSLSPLQASNNSSRGYSFLSMTHNLVEGWFSKNKTTEITTVSPSHQRVQKTRSFRIKEEHIFAPARSLAAADETSFQVSNFTGSHYDSAIATLSDGAFVVVWESGNHGVFGQLYTFYGVKNGKEFQASTTYVEYGSKPAVAGLNDGGFLIAWMNNVGILAQRYFGNGSKYEEEFQVNTYMVGSLYYPCITGLNNAGFAFAWTGRDANSGDPGIYGQRYFTNNTKKGGEFRVNTYNIADPYASAITKLNDGGFAVVWTSSWQDGDEQGISGQRYTSTGDRNGQEFQINTYYENYQNEPAIASLQDDGFVVTWMSYNQTFNAYSISAQRYTADGLKNGFEFQVSAVNPGQHYYPRVTGLEDGGFVIIWFDENRVSRMGQVFAVNGSRKGLGFEVVDYSMGRGSYFSGIATLPDGGFIVTWSGCKPSQDYVCTNMPYNFGASDSEVYGQRFDSNGNKVTLFYTTQPSSSPTGFPISSPSSKPTQPSSSPTGFPTSSPSSKPTQPSSSPTGFPTSSPSSKPTQPSSSPTGFPISSPSSKPTQPSSSPTGFPTSSPSSKPTQPSSSPTGFPTSSPSSKPTQPSSSPTGFPISSPSSKPTQPSSSPTGFPTSSPSCQPTQPTSSPAGVPISSPSSKPTQPSSSPTGVPISSPSSKPTQPSSSPTGVPISSPSYQPSQSSPSLVGVPTFLPAVQLFSFPSGFPTSPPSVQPSFFPIGPPTVLLSGQPSSVLSTHPSSSPLFLPPSSPTVLPLSIPIEQPISYPFRQPTSFPSSQPKTSFSPRHPTSLSRKDLTLGAMIGVSVGGGMAVLLILISIRWFFQYYQKPFGKKYNSLDLARTSFSKKIVPVESEEMVIGE
jgi:hypothetical protein